jgi:arylsulfatase A-like enzyme
VEEIVLRYLDEGARDERPFFLFAYLWDPHYDFIPPAPYDTLFRTEGAEPFDGTNFELNPLIHPGMPPGRLAWLVDQYEGEIRWTDDLLGRLWEALRRHGLWENTVVVVTADHGEEFYDHGEKGHKNNLHAETIHVPLVIKWADGRRPAVDDRLAGLIDIFPTLVEATRTDFDGELHGRSLLGRARGDDDPLFFELVTTFYGVGANRGRNEMEQWWGVRRGDFKMVSVPGRRWNTLYDVRGDPTERSPVEQARPELLEEMLELLGPWQRRMQGMAKKHDPREPAFLSGEEIDRLKSLGYMGN